MKILSCKTFERIGLTLPDGTPITIQVVRIKREVAYIGIEAPKHIVVNREEVHLGLETARRRDEVPPYADGTHGPGCD